MSSTLREEIRRESNRNTNGVVYHSRMMYLTPIEAVGMSPKKVALTPGQPLVKKKYNPTEYRKQPCPNHRLVPPVELMTRPEALRFAYLQHHDPKGAIKKMNTLEKRVDPEELRSGRIS